MEKLELHAKVREEKGKKVKFLREKRLVPGIVYGSDFENLPILMDYNTVEKVYNQAGDSSLVNIITDGNAPLTVLFQDVAYDPVTGKMIHIDFFKIKEGEKLTTNVELNFFGESKAVKDLGGTLYKGLDELEIECLPKDLVSEINVDISVLKTFEDKILVSNIKAPEGVEVLNEPDALIAKVEEPRSEEELKQLEQKVEISIDNVKLADEKEAESETEEQTQKNGSK